MNAVRPIRALHLQDADLCVGVTVHRCRGGPQLLAFAAGASNAASVRLRGANPNYAPRTPQRQNPLLCDEGRRYVADDLERRGRDLVEGVAGRMVDPLVIEVDDVDDAKPGLE
jgi:hypothetical protein